MMSVFNRGLFFSFVLGLTPVAALAGPTQGVSDDGVFPHVRNDLPKKKNATVGNYLYIGTAPKFAPEDLKLTTSKVGLTLRVTAKVTQELKDRYAIILYKRFQQIAEKFLADSQMTFDSLYTLPTLATKTKLDSVRLWLKIVAPYSNHVLEGNGLSIEKGSLSSDEYKRNVLTSLLRYYFQNQSLTLDSLTTLNEYFKDPQYVRQLSNDLFQYHLGSRFSVEASVGEKTGKPYIGDLTYVYPIAATAEGPFDQPKEGVREFGLQGNIESRIWSDKWDDEFGGMPFLLIEWSGVAFHGPITNYRPLDVWFLRRGFVSHGCHRMDSSDIMELRALMPVDLSLLQKNKNAIQHVTLNWVDVADWNHDGSLEAIDVQYYDIPSYLPEPKKGSDLDALAAKLSGDAAQATWRKKHYTAYNKHANANGTPFYDAATGLYSGLPKYEVVKNKLVRNGVQPAVPVYTFATMPNRIIQYNDGKPMPKGYDRVGGNSPISFEKNLAP